MLGRWRFYVDAAAGTVNIDLLPDGRYTQVIAHNCGGQTDGPGGDWTLDGSHLELTSYRSVSHVTQDVRWFFGQWQYDLVLFAKDDPDAATMLLGLKK